MNSKMMYIRFAYGDVKMDPIIHNTNTHKYSTSNEQTDKMHSGGGYLRGWPQLIMGASIFGYDNLRINQENIILLCISAEICARTPGALSSANKSCIFMSGCAIV